MILKRLTVEEFNSILGDVFTASFAEAPRKIFKYNFALLVEDDSSTPLGFMACLEMDVDSVWVLYGGAFPSAKKSFKAISGFHTMVRYLSENYSRARIDTATSNISMIKMAYSAGFEIVGVENQFGDMYVNMTREF